MFKIGDKVTCLQTNSIGTIIGIADGVYCVHSKNDDIYQTKESLRPLDDPRDVIIARQEIALERYRVELQRLRELMALALGSLDTASTQLRDFNRGYL